MSGTRSHADQFRKNDDTFRNTMESIFQKYSKLNDPGVDVCLKTMTCRTKRGYVPIDSAEGERQWEKLKIHVNANHSIRECDDLENDQMDLSGISEDDLTYSDQKENNECLWQGGESPQHSINVINSSRISSWSTTEPQEEDEELEKTLSSHGSTLLDVYPSMLSQIGEAYRRQRVTDTAKAVLQKYRRKQRQTGVSNPRIVSLRNRILNKTIEISYDQQKQSFSNCIKSSSKFQDLFKNKLKPSPVKNASYEASACFYSPRRNVANVSGVSNESQWTELHFDRNPMQSPARVIDLTTNPDYVSPSLSPDLNQTYEIGPTDLSSSGAVPASVISNCLQPVWQSPKRTSKGLSLIEQRRMSIAPQSSHHLSNVSLDKVCFRDSLQSLVSSPQRGLIHLSPSKKSIFRPASVPSFESQMSVTPQPSQHLSNVSLDKDCFRDRLQSLVSSPQRGLIHLSPSKKSIFRPMSMSDFEDQQSTAMQMSPLRHQAQAHSERSSPYSRQEMLMSSPPRSVYSQHQQTEMLISPRLSKHQHSHPGPKSTYLVKHDSYSRPQIDTEFRKLYHHFICHGTPSPCPSSHCHLCEKRLNRTSPNTSFSSSDMSGLGLTPLRATLKKRRRQPEVEESLKFKRFRESCSPIKHLQRLPQQLKDRYQSSNLAEVGEDKHTWERAILLQCPSPRFLRGTGNLRRIRESKLKMEMNLNASSWSDVPSRVHMIKVESPFKSFNQDMTPVTPSLSRRQLQYGYMQ